ncbi:MAG: hypothetical protein BZY83_00660 [SAR202 cluster bacterium Casp-Chloro-G2]|nr:MAG: hypothetical protein BZY83_00660 [SAR202 cluster bacterium Casp-Chloro-G2]
MELSEDSPEAVFQFMIDQGWSDGLPVIPPTADRVRAMLEYAGRDASELVGYINPDAGAATVEKIAVNAVMAGCLPEYMPVLIAAVQAVTEPAFNIHGLQTTTNPASPLMIVNGPVRGRIGLNSGRGTLGPGYRANATIGRALRLLLLNVGGAKPWSTDMAVHGSAAKFSACMGENEEDNVWEPLHVERGFSPEQSTVTVVGAQGYSNCLTFYKEPESFLTMIASAMADISDNNYLLAAGNPLVILTPGHSRIFAENGYNKQMVKQELFERSKVPIDRFPKETSVITYEDGFAMDGDLVCPCRSADDIIVAVSGGPEPYHVLYCGNFGDTTAVTKEIQLP